MSITRNLTGLLLMTLLVCVNLNCRKSEKLNEETPPDLSRLTAAVTPKGTSTGNRYTQTVGADGGLVSSPDGMLVIDIPAGALSANTTIGIEPITNEAPLGAGGGYRLTPEGTEFAKPVTLTFKINEGLQPGLSWIVTQKTDGTWLGCRNTDSDEAAQTLSVQTHHFSDWATGKLIDFRLAPAKATVKLKGQLQLYVNGFVKSKGTEKEEQEDLAPLVPLYPKGTGVDDLAPLPRITDLSTLMEQTNQYRLDFKQWRLSPEVGSLKANGSKAVYTAPDQLPNPNAVNVSVDIEATRSSRTTKLILLSSITITDQYYAKFTVDGVTSVFDEADIIKPGSLVTPTSDYASVFIDDNGELGIVFILGSEDKNISISTLKPGVGELPFATKATPAGTVDITYLRTASLDAYNNANNQLVKVDIYCEEGRSSTGSLTLTEYSSEKGAVVAGSFSGTLWNTGVDNTCKNRSVEISGEFMMPVNRY